MELGLGSFLKACFAEGGGGQQIAEHRRAWMLMPAFCARGLTSLPHPPKTIQCEWKVFQAKHGLLFYEDLSSPIPPRLPLGSKGALCEHLPLHADLPRPPEARADYLRLSLHSLCSWWWWFVWWFVVLFVPAKNSKATP